MIPVDIQYHAIPNTERTAEEVNWLRRRTAAMTEKEKILFNGAMRLKPPQSVADVIDLAAQLDCFDALYPAADRRELGRFVATHLHNVFSELSRLRNQEVGEAYEQEHPGAYVYLNTCEGRGAYVTLESEPQRLYDGTNLDALPKPDFNLRLRLSSPDCPEGVWVRIVDRSALDEGYPDELAIALDSLDAVSLESCTLQEAQCALPGLGDITAQYAGRDIEELIRSGEDLDVMLEDTQQRHPQDLDRLLAALESEGCSQLEQVVDINLYLHCYDPLIPGAGQTNTEAPYHFDKSHPLPEPFRKVGEMEEGKPYWMTGIDQFCSHQVFLVQGKSIFKCPAWRDPDGSIRFSEVAGEAPIYTEIDRPAPDMTLKDVDDLFMDLYYAYMDHEVPANTTYEYIESPLLPDEFGKSRCEASQAEAVDAQREGGNNMTMGGV